MFLLWHPSLTATNLSYTSPVLETSATALCGTTGIHFSRFFLGGWFRICGFLVAFQKLGRFRMSRNKNMSSGTDGRFARKMLSLCMRVALQMRRNVQHHQALCWWRSGPQEDDLRTEDVSFRRFTGYSNKHLGGSLTNITKIYSIYLIHTNTKHIQHM